MDLLQAEDPWMDWEDVEPLFRRYPVLGLSGDTCFLTELRGRPRQGGAAQAEILTLLEEVEQTDPSLRTHPDLLRLARLVAGAPRLSPEREVLLVAEAQAVLRATGKMRSPAMDEIIAAYGRRVLRFLVRSRDLSRMMPAIEDYLQEGCIAVARAVAKFDRNRHARIGTLLYYELLNVVNRGQPEMSFPVRLPVHVFWRLANSRRQRRKAVGDLGEGVPAQRWLDVQVLGSGEWEDAYENGDALEPHTMAMPEPDPLAVVEAKSEKELLDEVLSTLSPREEQVLRLRFGLNDNVERTLEEIGRSFGVTRERIRQVEAKALKRLRHASRIRRLRREL